MWWVTLARGEPFLNEILTTARSSLINGYQRVPYPLLGMRHLVVPFVRDMPAEPQILLRGHTTSVTALHFLTGASCPRLLLSGDETGEVQRWDLELEEGEEVLKGHGSPILNICGRGDQLYVQYKDGDLLRGPVDRLHDDEASFITHPLNLPFEPALSFCRLQLLGDNCLLLPGPDNSAAFLTDVRTELAACGQFQQDGRGMLTAVHPTCAGSFLATYEDGTVALWELRMNRRPRSSVRAANDALFALTVAPRWHVAVVAGGVHTVSAVADADTGPLRVIRTAKLRTLGVGDAEWRPDSKVMATAGWDGVVRLWSGKRAAHSLLRPLAALRWHSRAVQRVTFSPDSTWLASSGSDRTIALWGDLFQS